MKTIEEMLKEAPTQKKFKQNLGRELKYSMWSDTITKNYKQELFREIVANPLYQKLKEKAFARRRIQEKKQEFTVNDTAGVKGRVTNLLSRLTVDNIRSARKIKNIYGRVIDLSDVFQEALLHRISKEDIIGAVKIKEAFFEWTIPSEIIKLKVNELFFKKLSLWNKYDASKIAVSFWERVDLWKEIKECFAIKLVHFKLSDAKEIKNSFGRGVDFSEEIKKAFLNELCRGNIPLAKEIENIFGEGIDFSKEMKEWLQTAITNGRDVTYVSQFEEYFWNIINIEEELRKSFLNTLKRGEINCAWAIKENLLWETSVSLEIKEAFLEKILKGEFTKAWEIKEKYVSKINFLWEIIHKKETVIEKFKSKGRMLVNWLIDMFDASSVTKLLEIMKEVVSKEELVDIFMKRKMIIVLIEQNNIPLPITIDKNFAKKLIDADQSYIILKHINMFIWLDAEIAKDLIMKWFILNILHNKEKFLWLEEIKEFMLSYLKKVDRRDLIKQYEEFFGEYAPVTRKQELFKNITIENIGDVDFNTLSSRLNKDKKFALELIKKKKRFILAEIIDQCEWFDWLDDEIAIALIESSYEEYMENGKRVRWFTDYAWVVADNRDKFKMSHSVIERLKTMGVIQD